MKKYIALFVKLLISTTILYVIFQNIPLSEIFQTIRQARIPFVLLALIIIPVQVWVAARQVKTFTDHHQMGFSTKEIFDINFSIHFYSLFLPGTLAGGAVRWHKFSKKNEKRAEALAVIVVNRLMNMIAMVGLALLAWIFAPRPEGLPPFGNLIAGLFLILGTFYFLTFNKGMARLIVKILDQGNIPFCPRIFQEKLLKCAQAGISFQNLPLKSHLTVLGHAVTHHLLGAAAFLLLALSIGMELPFLGICWIRSFSWFGALLPISFLGLGIRESFNIILLGIYQVTPAGAVAVSFLILFRNLFMGILGGVREGIKILLNKDKEKASE